VKTGDALAAHGARPAAGEHCLAWPPLEVLNQPAAAMVSTKRGSSSSSLPDSMGVTSREGEVGGQREEQGRGRRQRFPGRRQTLGRGAARRTSFSDKGVGHRCEGPR
jgi:hypothetical protein